MKTKRLVFMGSSEFSLAALRRLKESGFNICAVYSRQPKPTGRNYKIQKTIVHEYAEEQNIPVYTPRTLRIAESLEQFKALSADLVVVAAFGLIIPKSFLDEVPFINIHGSLLPRWRGAAPIQTAILEGDKETGITIMKMDEGVDTGDIISMKSVPIFPETTFGELLEKMSLLGAEMIEHTLLNFDTEIEKAYKQPNEGECYAQKISKEMGYIDWNESCVKNLRKIKAFSPVPAAWTEINGLRIKILDAKICSGVIEGQFVMKCSDGFLQLTQVQPAGKKVMSGEAFIRGHPQN